jgi:metallo-beta-lactamase family protein
MPISTTAVISPGYARMDSPAKFIVPMLRDSGHLQEEDAYWANKRKFSKHKPALPLYTVEDAEKALKLFDPANYGEDLFVNNNLRVKFKDAGHILGSSFVDIKSTNGRKALKRPWRRVAHPFLCRRPNAGTTLLHSSLGRAR